MRVWRDASIRSKCVASLLVAALGLSFFAVMRVDEKRARVHQAAAVRTRTDLVVRIGDLLHETQRERGRTAQFLTSKGAKFGPELTAQRAVTDQRANALASYVSAHGKVLDDAERAVLATAESALAARSDLRSQADGLTTPAKAVIGGYTELNAKLIAAAGAASKSDDPTIELRLEAYLAFLSAKEKAGLERAQLTSAFAADKWADGQYVLVTSLIANQASYLDSFTRQASPDVLAKWKAVQADPVFAQVAAYEQTALSHPAGKFAVTSTTWFDTQTAKIDALKTVEDFQAGRIRSLAAHAESAAQGSVRSALALAALVLLLALAAAAAAIRSITRPLREITGVAEHIAVGDIDVDVTFESRNEIGRLADAMRRLSGYVRESAQLAEALAAGDLSREVVVRSEHDVLGNALHGMVGNLSATVARIRDSGTQLARSSEQLAAANTQMSANAEETAAKAGSVSAAGDEMHSSINEVARSASEAAHVVTGAMSTIERTTATVANLAQSSQEIGAVVELIQTITGQTNLLALNATIEAARAGEAGKGFGVVADEVKHLAQQTASATEEIVHRIEAIQVDADAVVEVIAEVGRVVGEINGIAAAIAAAVEEQTATTQEIAHNMVSVSDAAASTSSVMTQSSAAAHEMMGLAKELDELVRQFQLQGA